MKRALGLSSPGATSVIYARSGHPRRFGYRLRSSTPKSGNRAARHLRTKGQKATFVLRSSARCSDFEQLPLLVHPF
jgi:hypothetical protein